MKLFKSAQKGFTLIELLVVISILGVLAAVVILNVTKYMGQGKTQAGATELANVQTAVSAYMYDNTGAIAAGTATPANSGGILSPYFLGSPHGSYSWDSTGKVTQTTYP
ncbi:MAG: prepilin-type N-terminal cleavage/methylation domain-containing protein [Dehalococcoidia bacterium]|jgi:type IV pilus assembly protein PilA